MTLSSALSAIPDEARGGEHAIVDGSSVMLLVFCIASGLALGVGDLLLQRTFPYPLANLANSGAVWAAAAFVLGMRIRRGRIRAAAAGCVLLVVAVEAYYLAAVLIQSDSINNLWSSSTFVWLTFGVVVGALFGVAGHVALHGPRRLQLAATAMISLVFLAEGLRMLLGSVAAATHPDDILYTALIEFAIAAVAGLSVTLARRRTNLACD